MAVVKALVIAGLVLLNGCAKPRPIEHVVSQPKRVQKSTLSGVFFFLKTIVEIKSPGPNHAHYAPGMPVESDKLVRFVLRENQVEVLSLDPLYTDQSSAAQTELLAVFPAAHLDVALKRNSSGEQTHEEEETQLRRPWQNREFVSLDLVGDAADPFFKQTRAASVVSDLEIDPDRHAIGFAVNRLLEDGTVITLRYSFLRYEASKTYQQRPYSDEDQLHFGFFSTATHRLNAFDQFTETSRQLFLNRWDTTKTVVFYLSENFPSHLKEVIRPLFDAWANAMKTAVGDSILELRENTGQKLGDLRYNLIAYDDSEHSAHGALGYSLPVTNPRTAELIKTDIILYGRVLKRAVFQELFWEKSRGESILPRRIPEALEQSRLPVPSLEGFIADAQASFSSRHTHLNEDVMHLAMQASQESVNPDVLEARIFAGVFGHEFGHCLGLSHNFMGSSSIMDYAFLQGHQTELGPYDRAALIFGYSPEAKMREAQLEKNFPFCSDDAVFSSRMPLCQQYGSASTLTELVRTQLDRYLSSYEVNNLRLDRIHFETDGPSYQRRILSLLLPLRLVYDNAHALLQAYGAKDANGRRNYLDLWKLARQRIEADSSTRFFEEVEVSLRTTVKTQAAGPELVTAKLRRKLDPEKIEAVIADARRAKLEAVDALRFVILDTTRREEDDFSPLKSDQVQVRGVLPDKILALTLSSIPTRHPILTGEHISPYSTAEVRVPQLFASLLSNTSEIKNADGSNEPYYRIRHFNMNLRKHALHLLSKELAQVGKVPEALNLIEIHKLPVPKGPFHTGENDKVQKMRTEFREFYKTLILKEIQKGEKPSEIEPSFSFGDFSLFDFPRNEFDNAYVNDGEESVYYAPVPIEGGDLKTASGLLIRNNINVAEDYLAAISEAREALEADVFNPVGRTTGALSVLLAVRTLDSRRHSLMRYLTGEQLFLKEMYLDFSQDR